MNPPNISRTFAAVPVIVAATWVFRRYSKRYYAESRAQISAVNGEFAELIGGIRVTQTHLAQGHFEARFAGMSDTYRRLRMRSVRLVGLYFPGMQFVSQVMTAVIIGVGASRVADGTLSVGVLVAFTMYLSQLYGPIQQLGQIFDSWQQATVSFDRIRELLGERTTVPDTGRREGASEAAAGELSLLDVTFGYTPDNPVVAGMDLRLEPGTTVALVGPTGAGKSTLTLALFRILEATQGSIFIDDIDISTLGLQDLRQSMAIIPQDAQLWQGTLRQNLDPLHQYTDSELYRVLKQARLCGIVDDHAAGLLQPVSEGGSNLSAGQRQLICIARAMVRQSHILVLDEATSSIDLETDQLVQQIVRTGFTGTTITIAHRLNTIMDSDRVLVVDDGRVIEDGSPAELTAGGGRFAQMVQAWDEAMET